MSNLRTFNLSRVSTGLTILLCTNFSQTVSADLGVIDEAVFPAHSEGLF